MKKKWKDSPEEFGYYFVEHKDEREIVHYDSYDKDVSHNHGICKLRHCINWKWWGPIEEPPELDD